MRSARTVRPTDIVALVTFDGRVYHDAARPWDRVGKEVEAPHPLESALEQWFSFATGKHTWVHIQGQTLRGLVSARKRGNRRAWEVDCLLAVGEDEQAVATGLLEQVSRGAAQAKVRSLFLRMERDAPLVAAARKAGFRPYLLERLYRRDEPAATGPAAATLPLRRRTAADAWALFRLYSQCTPEPVRREEAPTFEEWQANVDVRAGGRGGGSLVLERDGRVLGWLRTRPDGKAGRLDVLTPPDAADCARALLEEGLAGLAGRAPLFALVPVYLTSVATALRDAGFQEQGEFVVMVKRLTVPVGEARTVPARAAVESASFLVSCAP
ncbi:MAG TPA: hypothetical protein VIO14_08135 [Dehalococcoidia bacterium]